MKLFIGVPSYGDWASDFGQSLALLTASIAGDPPSGLEWMHLSRCESTIISEGRSDLAKDALERGASHLIWLDADMKFRPGQVRRLLSHDIDIVGATYPKRRPPHDMTAQDVEGGRIKPGDGDLIEARHMGMGLMVTKIEVFRKMPEPWFAFPWIEEAGRPLGEDVFFCMKARAEGFKVMADPVASQGIGHVGRKVYEAG